MRVELEDLPKARQFDLRKILKILFEEFDRSLATATQPWKKSGRILKVLLCRVDHPAKAPSGCDLLIVVNDKRLTDFANYWSGVEGRLLRERHIHRSIGCDIHLLVCTLADVNRNLAQGTPFFVGLVRTAMVVYDDGASTFVKPQSLPEPQARAARREYFRFWFPLSQNARELGRQSVERGVLRDAAFLFHQAVERAYHCVLLTLTLYSPKTHRIELLRSNSERVAPLLANAWPSESKFEKRCFNRLQRAYVEARYSENYRISEDELGWIDQHVGKLQELIRIENAIQDLPELTRDIFRARRLEALEYEEIARRFALDIAEVEMRIERALDAIARSLDDQALPLRPISP